MNIFKNRVVAVAVGAIIVVSGGGTAAYAASVNGDSITQNSVDSTEVQNGTLTGTDIKDATVSGVDIVNNSVTNADIADGTIVQNDISTNGVGTLEIANGSVTVADMNDDVFAAIRNQVSDTKGGLVSEFSKSDFRNAGILDVWTVSANKKFITLNAEFDLAEGDTAGAAQVSVEDSNGNVVGKCSTNLTAGGFAETCSFTAVTDASNLTVKFNLSGVDVANVKVNAQAIEVGAAN